MSILTKDVNTLYFPASISMEARDFIQLCLQRPPSYRPSAEGKQPRQPHLPDRPEPTRPFPCPAADLLDHEWFLVQAEFEMESHVQVIFPAPSVESKFAQGNYRSSQIRKVSELMRRTSMFSGVKGAIRHLGNRSSRISSMVRSSLSSIRRSSALSSGASSRGSGASEDEDEDERRAAKEAKAARRAAKEVAKTT